MRGQHGGLLISKTFNFIVLINNECNKLLAMDWRNAKILLASTATVVVATQVVRKAYKYFFGSSKTFQHESPNETRRNEVLQHMKREITDVLLFSDDAVRCTIKKPPKNKIDVCDKRELNCVKLIKYLKSARETLDVCMYLITSSEIAEQIIRLGEKHVIVRIVVDNGMAFTPPSQIKKLQEYSFIQVQTKKNNVMHHKFCIIDGPKAIKRKKILKAHAEKINIHAPFTKTVKLASKNKQNKGFIMCGSLNWSTQAMILNFESVIVTSNQDIVKEYEKEFEILWVENEPALMKTT